MRLGFREQPIRTLLRVLWLNALVGLAAFTVYIATCAPTITWRHSGADSAELSTAAWTLGIPHPPGYPLYTLLAAIFTHLLPDEPARDLALFSAFTACIGLAIYAGGITKLVEARVPRGMALVISASVALQFGFAPTLWSQATIAEVYAFGWFLVSILLWSAIAAQPPRRIHLLLGSAAFGLGLAHHLSIVLWAPVGLFLLSRSSFTRRDLLIAAALVLAPTLFYAYLPLRAAADPPVNWGNPRTLDNFVWLVSAAAYRSYWFSLSPTDFVSRIGPATQLLLQEFGPWGIALGLWGWVHLYNQRPRLTLVLGYIAMLIVISALLYSSRDSFIYLLPAFAIFALGIASGAADLITRTKRFAWGRLMVPLLLIFLPIWNLVANFGAMDLGRDRDAYEYAEQIFRALPDDALVLASGDEHLFALWYYRYVFAQPTSQIQVISRELLQFDWYAEGVQRRVASSDLVHVAASRRERELIDRASGQGRAVFVTVGGPDPPNGYDWEKQGSLIRLRGIKQSLTDKSISQNE